jgi:hypothetical protein
VYVSARTTSHCSVRYGRRLGKSTATVSMNCGTPAAAAAASSSDPPALSSVCETSRIHTAIVREDVFRLPSP